MLVVVSLLTVGSSVALVVNDALDAVAGVFGTATGCIKELDE